MYNKFSINRSWGQNSVENVLEARYKKFNVLGFWFEYKIIQWILNRSALRWLQINFLQLRYIDNILSSRKSPPFWKLIHWSENKLSMACGILGHSIKIVNYFFYIDKIEFRQSAMKSFAALVFNLQEKKVWKQVIKKLIYLW